MAEEIKSFQVEVTNPETKEVNRVTIEAYKIEKGKNQGGIRLQPDNIDTVSLSELVRVFGEKQILKSFIRTSFKTMCGILTNVAFTKDDGETVEEDLNTVQTKFAAMFSKFSKRGTTLKALRARAEELQALFPKLWNKVSDKALIAKYATDNSISDLDIAELKWGRVVKAELDELMEELKDINEAIAAKTTKEDDEGDEEPAQPVAQAA